MLKNRRPDKTAQKSFLGARARCLDQYRRLETQDQNHPASELKQRAVWPRFDHREPER